MDFTWYGNVQCLINITAIGPFGGFFIFLFVKLWNDPQIPGPKALIIMLLGTPLAVRSSATVGLTPSSSLSRQKWMISSRKTTITHMGKGF
ncbi:hypothetical protein Ancab_026649 [Ancistrocladus abbreviatus]